MFFKIKNERFKINSVVRYTDKGFSSATNLYYLSIWFSGNKERLIAFASKKELEDTIQYLDNIFKVQVV